MILEKMSEIGDFLGIFNDFLGDLGKIGVFKQNSCSYAILT
jgi:hypothetical protein